MQRQSYKEGNLRKNIKVTDPELEEKAKKAKKEKEKTYDVAAYPFGAEEMLLKSELEGK